MCDVASRVPACIDEHKATGALAMDLEIADRIAVGHEVRISGQRRWRDADRCVRLSRARGLTSDVLRASLRRWRLHLHRYRRS